MDQLSTGGRARRRGWGRCSVRGSHRESKLHVVLPPCQVWSVLVTDARVRAAYAEGAGIYRILPAAVAIPESQDDVVALVRQAAESHVALIPRGAGSGMPGGNVGNGVIVDLSTGFSDLVVDPPSRSARAGASVTWAEVNEAAKPYGLRLPPDPSSGAFATSGGMVATNAAGPRTVRDGRGRPWADALQGGGADGAVRTMRRGQRSEEHPSE